MQNKVEVHGMKFDAIEAERKLSAAAFDKAIKEGRLTVIHGDWNYAGDFMYMGVGADDVALFKHRETRRYIGQFPVRAEVMQ